MLSTTSLPSLSLHSGHACLPVGAHVHDGGVTYRVWAPAHREMRAVTGHGTTTRYVVLEPEPEHPGFWSGRDEEGRPGDLYWYQLDGRLLPDPASRFQPTGVDGPSQVVDPGAYAWQCPEWRRPRLRGRVIYELHLGTFTPEGTCRAAQEKLPALVELGVNTIELMPVAEFAGRWNWGYDGVMPFAPTHRYGTPDELRALVDAAHALGLAVILDVVYNHLGPTGNVLPAFAEEYFRREGNLWGASLNFTARPVREYFLQNACRWFDEYRIDGLRLDAVHAIHDSTEPDIVTEIAAAARARGAFVIAEDDRNDARLLAPRRGDGPAAERRGDAGAEGGGVDGMWADDFHHVMRVALTGQAEVHYANYTGTVDEWITTLRDGWLYQGQYFKTWQRNRGTPCADVPPEAFVFCISNHDQVGNRPLGDRLSDVVAPAAYRAMSMLLCLSPYTPLMFQGQEWAARTPFPFFCDHPGELGAKMAGYRMEEFRHYGATYAPDVLARMPDPQDEATFLSARLDWAERDQPPHARTLALYRDCLQLRRSHEIFQSPPRDRWSVAPLGPAGLALHWQAGGENWTLVVSWCDGMEFVPPDETRQWTMVLASNEARFGGDPGAELQSPGAVLWRAGAAGAG